MGELTAVCRFCGDTDPAHHATTPDGTHCTPWCCNETTKTEPQEAS